jgi:outer membrane protein
MLQLINKGSAMRNQIRLVAVAAVLLSVLSAPAVSAANLSALYDLARTNDAQYAIAVQTAAATREKFDQGRALLFPTVGVNGYARENSDRSTSYSGTRTYPSTNIALTATQPLLRPANVATYEQGSLQAQIAEQQLKLAEQELMVRVARSYFEVLQAQDALATLGNQKKAFATQLAQAKRNLEVGLAPITDVNEAQSRHDLTVAQEIAARNDLELKRRALERIIGGDLPPLAALDAAVNIDILSTEQLLVLYGAAPQKAWQVKIGQTNEQIARLEVDKQKAGHLPTVDLAANLGRTSNANYGVLGGQTSHSRNAYIGIDAALPLYQGGGVNSRVREAGANVNRARSEVENARRQATLDARQGLQGVESGLALQTALRQAVNSGEANVRSIQRGLQVGLRTRVDLLNAEQQLYTTLRDLSAARYQTLIAGVQLKAAAGALNGEDFRSLDGLLK